jgi:hypothetical protein
MAKDITMPTSRASLESGAPRSRNPSGLDTGAPPADCAGRGGKLRQSIGPWQPTSSPGREIAAVLHPHRFCRSTRQWVIRTPKAKGALSTQYW